MPHERCEILVEGHLSGGRSLRLEEPDIQCGPGGDSVLSGPLPDQAALHGVLARIRDLKLKLISVNRRLKKEEAANDQ